MSKQQQFLETVKIVDGTFIHPELNLQRMKQAMKEIYHSSIKDTFFQEMIIPEEMKHGVVKCRILYGASIDDVEFQQYVCRKVSSLKLVNGADIDYFRKYADRSSLMKLLQEKGSYDDILITQNGMITDTSYSNVVLSDGSSYYTPSTYLLNGTCRQRLIAEGKITPIKISVSDLFSFENIYLINAMLDLEDEVIVPVRNILR